MASLKQVRAQVYAVNTEELFLVDMAIGAPVLGGNVRPVAAVHGGADQPMEPGGCRAATGAVTVAMLKGVE